MTTFCQVDGRCKNDDEIYGVVDHHTQRLHRLTFSKSLAQLIADKTGLQTECFSYGVGKPLAKHEKSSTGMYALLDARTGLCLRISLDPGIAALHGDGEYRTLAEATLFRN